MLHSSRIYLVAQRQVKGEYVPFSLEFVKESGEIVNIQSCIFQNEYKPNRTMDIKLPGGEIRTIRTSTIINFNGEEVFV
jgi:hypothetical protein